MSANHVSIFITHNWGAKKTQTIHFLYFIRIQRRFPPFPYRASLPTFLALHCTLYLINNFLFKHLCSIWSSFVTNKDREGEFFFSIFKTMWFEYIHVRVTIEWYKFFFIFFTHFCQLFPYFLCLTEKKSSKCEKHQNLLTFFSSIHLFILKHHFLIFAYNLRVVQKTSTCVFIEYCVEIYNQLRIGYEYSYNI